jgi:hypothetical protein
MTTDYAPTPVENFLDPDDPAMFPRLTSVGDGALVVRSIHAALAPDQA